MCALGSVSFQQINLLWTHPLALLLMLCRSRLISDRMSIEQVNPYISFFLYTLDMVTFVNDFSRGESD